MRNCLLGCLVSWVAGASLVFAQPAPRPGSAALARADPPAGAPLPAEAPGPGGAAHGPSLAPPEPEFPHQALPAIPDPPHYHPEHADTNCWVTFDYLLWKVKNAPLPVPLVTSGPSEVPGSAALDARGTSVLLGNSSVDLGTFSGGRLAAGAWCGTEAIFGVEASGFALEEVKRQSSFASDPQGNPRLGVPFFNRLTSAEDVAVVSSANQFAGNIVVSSSSQLWGAECDLLVNLFRDPSARDPHLTVDFLTGFRYISLEESLDLRASTTPIPPAVAFFRGQSLGSPASTSFTDSFRTTNHFYGWELGTRVQYRSGRLVLALAGKVGLGSTNEVVVIDGRSTLFGQGGAAVQTVAGGLFAQRGNIDHRTDHTFSAIPEGEIKLGYRFTNSLHAFVGYNALYWVRVARPGDQINRNVNAAQPPTLSSFLPTASPAPESRSFSTSEFWAQGLTLGLELSY